jgi:hypothetical protein
MCFVIYLVHSRPLAGRIARLCSQALHKTQCPRTIKPYQEDTIDVKRSITSLIKNLAFLRSLKRAEECENGGTNGVHGGIGSR